MTNLFLTIVATGILIVFFLLYDKKTKNGGTDERQEKEQNVSYKIAYFFVLFANFITMSAIRAFDLQFCYETIFIGIIIVSAGILMSIMIWKDCLLTKIENKKVFILILVIWLIIIAIWLVKLVNQVTAERIVMLTSCIITLLICLITLSAKKIYDKKKSDEENTIEE